MVTFKVATEKGNFLAVDSNMAIDKMSPWISFTEKAAIDRAHAHFGAKILGISKSGDNEVSKEYMPVEYRAEGAV